MNGNSGNCALHSNKDVSQEEANVLLSLLPSFLLASCFGHSRLSNPIVFQMLLVRLTTGFCRKPSLVFAPDFRDGKHKLLVNYDS